MPNIDKLNKKYDKHEKKEVEQEKEKLKRINQAKDRSKRDFSQEETSEFTLIKKYFDNTVHPELSAEQIEKICEDENKCFIKNFTIDYRKNNLERYYKNALQNKTFLAKFFELNKAKAKEGSKKLNLIFALVLQESIFRGNEDDLIIQIKKIYLEINKDYIKKIKKKSGLNDKTFAEFVAITIPSFKNRNIKFNNSVYFLNRLISRYANMYMESYGVKDNDGEYESFAELEEVLKSFFKFLFKKDLHEFLLLEMLERKDNLDRNKNSEAKTMWNRITNTVLNMIEGMDKEDIRDFLLQYGRRRKNNFQEERRVRILTCISDDTYPKIMKIAKDVASSNSEYKKFLD